MSGGAIDIEALLDRAFTRTKRRLSAEREAAPPEPVTLAAEPRDTSTAKRPQAPTSPAQRDGRAAMSARWDGMVNATKRGIHTDADADLIARHLASKGTTKCPPRFAEASQASIGHRSR